MNTHPDTVSTTQAATSPPWRSTAAIAAQSGFAADAVIDGVVRQLQHDGCHIVGHRQRQIPGGDGNARCKVQLQSIRTGEHHSMTQQLGSGSISCNVDPEAMERLALALCNELDKTVDLVIINRFGKRESQGAGFRSVIERAMEFDLPVLTVVKENWQGSWLDYGGDWVSILPPDYDTVMHWYQDVSVRARHP